MSNSSSNFLSKTQFPSLPFAFSKNVLLPLKTDYVHTKNIESDDLIISINNGRIRIDNETPLLHKDSVDFNDNNPLVVLGEFNQSRILIHHQKKKPQESEYPLWQNLRVLALNLPTEIASICAHASAVNHWHQHHQFCGLCGSKTELGKEHSRVCCNEECKHSQFPRVDPAVIMSVINEKDEILLGRQPSWDEKRYSVVAGFLAHGETLEECVAREVLEETGVVISSVEYIASQPWPFPGSIMLGFQATAQKQGINTADDELEHALWISREELQRKRDNKEMFISPRLSISRYLIELWIKG